MDVLVRCIGRFEKGVELGRGLVEGLAQIGQQEGFLVVCETMSAKVEGLAAVVGVGGARMDAIADRRYGDIKWVGWYEAFEDF